MSTLPIQRATIEQIVEYRDRAIELTGDAFDILMDSEAKTAEAGTFLSAACYRATRKEIEEGWTPPRAKTAGEIAERRADHIAEATKRIDRGIWKHIVEATDLERLMDATAREEFRKQIAEDLPPLTVENIYATLEGFLEQADMIFKRGIAVVFSKLDRRFRSHDGFKIGSRIILNNALGEYGWWNHHFRQDDTIRDIERTFCVLTGKPMPERTGGIIGMIDAELHQVSGVRQFEVENEFFKARIFMNGNIHLWFTDKSLVKRINRLLADYYGEAIGDSPDVASQDEMPASYHVVPAKNYGFFETSEALCERLFDTLCDSRSLDGQAVLEPSAGLGILADKARALGGKVHCVEIQQAHVAVLRDKGHQVTRADFLTLTTADLPQFDIIVMNPPFDNGRDCDHVTHALKFLKPGGALVAIMSARAEFKDDARHRAFRTAVDRMDNISRWGAEKWRDLPAGSFAHAGTNVNTVLVALRKPVPAEQRAAA